MREEPSISLVDIAEAIGLMAYHESRPFQEGFESDHAGPRLEPGETLSPAAL